MSAWHDSESKSRQLTRDSMPAKAGLVRRLTERVNELEQRLEALELATGGDSHA